MVINPHKKLHLMILFAYLMYVYNFLNIRNLIIFNTQKYNEMCKYKKKEK